jgi:large subunit ribosomal protein L13
MIIYQGKTVLLCSKKITEVTIMSTYMPKGDITDRQWYVLDAEGRTLGEVAVEAATILRGKHKPTFTPHADCGDSVIVINASKIVLTGNKLNDKIYYHHTGYVGNMKAVKYGTLMQQKPEFVVEKAVKGMLPDNTIGRNAMTRIRIYAGAEHKQEAQKPIVREF